MRGLTLFEPGDLNTIMAWYLTGKVTMYQLCDELNAKLRDKAEAERDLEEYRRPTRPNCF